ncbi:MAG: peroxiredoxin [Kiritimatiellia bacterium]
MHIVGVSYGSPERASKWVENQGYNYEVWSDTDKVLGRALGAGDGNVAKRITVVLDAQGRPRVRYPAVSVGTHPSDVLDDIKKLRSQLGGG